MKTTTLDRAIKRLKQDMENVGTKKYRGYAYFWNHEYRHDLRPLPPKKLKAIHNDLLSQGLSLSGTSDLHKIIIDKHSKKNIETILDNRVILMDLPKGLGEALINRL